MLKTKLQEIKTRGAITNSSKFLTENMLNKINFVEAKCIIELGAGDGCMTKEILNKMKNNTKLIAFEMDKKRFSKLTKIQDQRLIIVNDYAQNIKKYLNQTEVDFIISGLPLGAMSIGTVNKILQEAHSILKPEGKYIQFQYSLINFKELKQTFTKVDLDFTLINIPPAFVYTCQK